MPDDFHAYKENLQSGATEVQISEHYDGGDLDDEQQEQSDAHRAVLERDTTDE